MVPTRTIGAQSVVARQAIAMVTPSILVGHRVDAVERHRSENYLTRWLTFQKSAPILNHMVELNTSQLGSIFHALSDETRRRMLRDLADGERTVSALAEPFAMSLAAASKHIKVLEGAGLIRREVHGRVHICRLDPGPLAGAHEWLNFYERFWTDRLNVQDRLLREADKRPPSTPRKRK